MLTKEECEKALDNVKNGYRFMLPNRENVFDVGVSILNQLIEEHFYNPPLTIEEIKTIKAGTWLWDSQSKRFRRFNVTCPECIDKCKPYFENRFYRKQVEE